MRIRLASRPDGQPTSENFTITEKPVPVPGEGQLPCGTGKAQNSVLLPSSSAAGPPLGRRTPAVLPSLLLQRTQPYRRHLPPATPGLCRAETRL